MKNISYSPALFPHWTEIDVRFRDLDPLNHVNNAVFNSYFEEARICFMGDTPGFKNQFEEGKSFVLAKTTIEYRSPVTYPGRLLIGTGISELGNSSITGIQVIFESKHKKLVATARSKGVWFDLNKQRPTRLPEIENPEQLIVDL